MILSQASIFDFDTVARPPIEKKRIQLRYTYGQELARVFKTDAESFISSIGQLYDGKSLSDTRLLTNYYHGPIKEHYFRSGESWNEEHPFHSFLQMMGIVHKELRDKDDVIDVLSLSEYDPIKHTYDYDYALVESAWMDEELLHLDTDRGDGYDMMVVDDSLCDRYRVEPYSPEIKTEHFCIEALRRGASYEEVSWIQSNYACNLNMYRPFSRDWKTGRIQENDVFTRIMELSERFGIIPQIMNTVPKPEPEPWGILPAYTKNYCQHSKGCEDAKKDRYNCICCHKFLYNRQPVDVKHQNRPDVKRPKGSYDDGEDEE